MYLILALISGVVVALMVALNGSLTNSYGVYSATVVIHIIGTLVAFVCMKLTKSHAFPKKKIPLWMYLGGVVGVTTTVFNNLAFGTISMTAIVALSLLAQTVASVLIDCFGLFSMPRRRLRLSTLIGLLFSFAGICWMVFGASGEVLLALLVSFGAGISIVSSRMINARLAAHTSAISGSFVNHLIGLPVSIVVLLLLGRSEFAVMQPASAPAWAYIGGALGVAVVLLFNLTVPKVSAFRLTLLSFVGQVFTGVAIDLLLQNTVSQKTFFGGLLIVAGLCVELLLGRLSGKKRASD